jgi:hypothetical protein
MTEKSIDGLKEKYRSSLINKITWKSWEEKPEEGKKIWVLLWHSKGHFPSSFQIAAGEVEYSNEYQNEMTWRVNTCDYDGAGCNCYYPNQYDNGFLWWCDKWEISVPEDMISWDWDPGVR